MLGTLKVHTHQKLIDRSHKFMSVLELVSYYNIIIEEMYDIVCGGKVRERQRSGVRVRV